MIDNEHVTLAAGPGKVMSDRLSDHQYQVLARFRYALRQFLRFSEDAAQEVGLTPQQHQALLAVKGFPERRQMTLSELAERLQIRHHSAVGLVNRLTGGGLLERIADTDDRRQVFVRLTADGERVLARLSAAHRAELRHIGPTLNLLLEDLAAADRPGEGRR